MAALALTIILFAFWLILGYAVASTLNVRGDALQNALLAPTVGIAVTLLPTFWLNRLGLPIARFAPILLVALILLTAILLWWRRPVLPLKKYLPFALILIVGLLIVAQPLLYFGFDWRSYGNDDMANYVLRAARLLNHGFYDVPTIEGIRRDYSQYFWFMDVPSGTRAGADMLLAWGVGALSAPLQLSTLQLFMPVILAFHLALISAGGALVYSFRRYRLAALCCTGLLAFSALTALGVLYQLIAQVLGVALMNSCVALLLRPLRSPIVRPRPLLQYGVLLSILISALWLVYPEITPFFILSFALYVLIGVIRRWWTLSCRSHVLNFVPVVLLTLLFLNSYVADYFAFVVDQTTYGVSNGTNSVFPYFLQPSGLANLWGLQSISKLPAEPWLSLTIIIGGLMLLLVVAASIVLMWRGNSSATVAVVMLAFAAVLFIRQGGFGLFKLAMFSQPFLIGTLTMCFLLWFQTRWTTRLRWLRLAPVILLAIASLPALRLYVNSSWGQTTEFVTFYDISNLRLNSSLNTMLKAKTPALLISDSANSVAGKFQALETASIPTGYITEPFFWFMPPGDRDFLRAPCLPDKIHIPYYTECRVLYNDIYDQFKEHTFAHHDPSDPTKVSTFSTFLPDEQAQLAMATTPDSYWLFSTAQMTVLNRSRLASYAAQPFVLLPDSDASNVLIYIYSLATNEVRSFRDALGPLTADYFYPQSDMQGAKRYLLLRAVNLATSTRLVLNMTATLRGDDDRSLPPAAVIGDQRYPLSAVGRGSARLFSAPLKSQQFDGLDYLLLDLGAEYLNEYLPPFQTGIMGLYGANVLRFSGIPVAYLRNVSLISDAEYAQMSAPSAISAFPQDLANPALEYSGIYEDGWSSEHAYFGLTKTADSGDLVVRGVVPQIADPNFATTLRILVDGVEMTTATLHPGEFEVRTPASTITIGRHRIELQFSNWQSLPGEDKRPTTALLKIIGFE